MVEWMVWMQSGIGPMQGNSLPIFPSLLLFVLGSGEKIFETAVADHFLFDSRTSQSFLSICKFPFLTSETEMY